MANNKLQMPADYVALNESEMSWFLLFYSDEIVSPSFLWALFLS